MTSRFEGPTPSSGISRDPIVVTSEVAEIRAQLDRMGQKDPNYEPRRDYYYVVSQNETEHSEAQSRALGGNALNKLQGSPAPRLPTL
ncbi:MAG TPA: hypothetical protein VGE34_00800 [Candidatus Saccharimonadales bacterium]